MSNINWNPEITFTQIPIRWNYISLNKGWSILVKQAADVWLNCITVILEGWIADYQWQFDRKSWIWIASRKPPRFN